MFIVFYAFVSNHEFFPLKTHLYPLIELNVYILIILNALSTLVEKKKCKKFTNHKQIFLIYREIINTIPMGRMINSKFVFKQKTFIFIYHRNLKRFGLFLFLTTIFRYERLKLWFLCFIHKWKFNNVETINSQNIIVLVFLCNNFRRYLNTLYLLKVNVGKS